MRDAREDWKRFAAAMIPSKAATPQLDTFLSAVQEMAAEHPPLRLLDVGCGTGLLARRLHAAGFAVTGVDINPDAVRAAHDLAPAVDSPERSLRFHTADFASEHPPCIAGEPFDVVVCQLVLSIIGDAGNRRNLLRHVRDNLRQGGWLYVSASGVSDSINPGYARLYAEDAQPTGEPHSYFSRDDQGHVLYMTHHFTVDELATLLESAGFGQVGVTSEKETSSRRPDEAAYFLYATCRRA
ncbi:MAG: class I SAM-dependent methyltransferase [Planctomycetaceae bacterium]